MNEKSLPAGILSFEGILPIKWVGYNAAEKTATLNEYTINPIDHRMRVKVNDLDVELEFDEGEGFVGYRNLQGHRRSKPLTLDDRYVSNYEFISGYDQAEVVIEIFLTLNAFNTLRSNTKGYIDNLEEDSPLGSLRMFKDFGALYLFEDHTAYFRVDFTSYEVSNSILSSGAAKPRAPLKALIFRSIESLNYKG